MTKTLEPGKQRFKAPHLSAYRWRFQRAKAKLQNADTTPPKHILFAMPRMFAVEAIVSAAESGWSLPAAAGIPLSEIV